MCCVGEDVKAVAVAARFSGEAGIATGSAIIAVSVKIRAMSIAADFRGFVVLTKVTTDTIVEADLLAG